jgi:hypothetical protein
MDWREVIIKRKQIKDKSRQKPQTRMSGGSRPSQASEQYLQSYSNRDDSLDDVEEDRLERQELLNATREDLIDKIMDVIGSYNDEQLMELLLGTQGNIDVAAIQFKDNR